MSTYIRVEFVVSTVDRHTLHTSQRSRHNFTNNVAIGSQQMHIDVAAAL